VQESSVCKVQDDDMQQTVLRARSTRKTYASASRLGCQLEAAGGSRVVFKLGLPETTQTKHERATTGSPALALREAPPPSRGAAFQRHR